MKEITEKSYRFTDQHLLLYEMNTALLEIKHLSPAFRYLEVNPKLLFDMLASHAIEYGSIPRGRGERKLVAEAYYEKIREQESMATDGKVIFPFNATTPGDREAYYAAVEVSCKILENKSLITEENFKSLPGWQEKTKFDISKGRTGRSQGQESFVQE